MGNRYHLRSHVPWVYVPGGGYGLAQPQNPDLASFQYPADFSNQALQEALSRYGKPEIFNTDQGAQFTSNTFSQILKGYGIAISMDDRGRGQDNLFVERLWWTIKDDYLYLHSLGCGSDLRQGLTEWACYYNQDHQHSSLDDRTLDEVFDGQPHPFRRGCLMLH